MQQTATQIQLPPRETWEAGTKEAEDLAGSTVATWEKEQKVIDTTQIEGVTAKEVKLSVSVLVLRRQVLELRSDILNATMHASRLRDSLFTGKVLSHEAKMGAIETLSKIERKGQKIAEAWMRIDRALRMWSNPKFWENGRQPDQEARNLMSSIVGANLSERMMKQ